MVKVNPHYKRIEREVIFPIIEEKLKAFDGDVINLGVGDVAMPLPFDVAQTISACMVEMTRTPIGYGPAEGYLFLRDAIRESYGEIELSVDEIFISDGINTDLANIYDLFDPNIVVATVDPGYPVFGDTGLMGGKTVIKLPCLKEHGFIPQPPKEHVDVIYLCSPGNPTGVAMTYDDLKMWIDYAKEHKAIILFDGAYSAFIRSEGVPKSIYEIEGAREVAIEMRSFSKSAGFTGLRCSYSVIPKETGLTKMWKQRQSTKYNGCAYPIQRGAYAAIRSEEAMIQVEKYLTCARMLKEGLDAYGGIDSPYLWLEVPQGLTSWEYFDVLLNEHNILGIPGSGFGPSGEGYVRLSAFTTIDNANKVLERLYAH